MKIFSVRKVPKELEKNPREKIVNLVDNTGEVHPIFPKDEVEIKKELTKSPPRTKSWITIKVYKKS